jgi:hypothetical protein
MTTATLRDLVEGTALTLECGLYRTSQFDDGCFILKPGDVANKRHPERPTQSRRMDGPIARRGDLAINLDFKPGCAVEIDEMLEGVEPTKGVALARVFGSPEVDGGFLRAWILSGELERQLQPRHRGSTMTYVKLADLLDTVIPVPSLNLQRELAQRFAAARAELLIATRYVEEAREVLELESMYLVVKATDEAQHTGH